MVNVAIFFFWQPFGASPEEGQEFLYRRAAVPCELMEQRPLTVDDLVTGECQEAPGSQTFFPEKNVWLSVLTSLFLHASVIHLLGNMWFLWIFGDNVEDRFGHVLFVAIYLLSGIAGTAGFVLGRPEEVMPLIGASGAIAGVLGAYLVAYPFRLVLAVAGFFLLPVPAVVFIGLWVIAQFLVVDSSVAWEAHVYGFAAGVLLVLLLSPLVPSGRRERRR